MVLPRIPHTTPFPPPRIHPPNARTLPAATAALTTFLTTHHRTLLITGAGLSVASNLRDYRGSTGSYRLNPSYRPIFFHEFTSQHLSRQRYWARSFLGYPSLRRAKPNRGHAAIAELWRLGVATGVVTQNVDSLHAGTLPTVELHGALRCVVCLHCGERHAREHVQRELLRLNPAWAPLLESADEVQTNPDGDAEVEGVDYRTFRYPGCSSCAEVGADGAYVQADGVRGVLKPAVTFFGESVEPVARIMAERWEREAEAVLVIGSSLATYSAWRLVKEAMQLGKGIGVVNMGGIRGEEVLSEASTWLRLEMDVGELLEETAKELGGKVELSEENDEEDVKENVSGLGLRG